MAITIPSSSTTYTLAGNLTISGTATLTSPKISTSINDSNGNEIFKLTATASAVNEFTVANAATGNAPTISATGSDTNIDIKLTPKGTGNLVLGAGNIKFSASGKGILDNNGNEQLLFTTTASAVNYINITNAATGGAVEIAAAGDDTDIDLKLSPKGSGYVQFGTHTALGAETLSGYITIKDSGGTLRKIGVIS